MGGTPTVPTVSRTAFTLVELLTVIAVLAVLLSLLLPGLSQARQQAQAAACGSNLRQVALANMFYADANRQAYCPGAADFVTTNLHRWHGARDRPSQPFDGSRGPLVPYLGSDMGVRRCPSLRISLADNDPRRFEKNCGGYGYNLAFLGRRLRKRPTGGYRVRTDLVGAQTEWVRRPARTLMFADSGFVSGGLIEYSFAEPPYFPTFGVRADPSIHFRHRNRSANVAWCDGHVDRRRMAFTWSSGLYVGDPEACDVGWFGKDTENTCFDLD